MRHFKYLFTNPPGQPANTMNYAKIFDNGLEDDIRIIILEKQAYSLLSDPYKAVDIIKPSLENYWYFFNYVKDSDLNGPFPEYNYYSTLSSSDQPAECSRYKLMIKESAADADLYNISTVNIPNYIIDAAGNITPTTPTIQTFKTLKTLNELGNLIQIESYL
jgi:hypothetical protein